MQEEDDLQEVDSRTLREYLRDVEETELRGLYPEYSTKRKWILSYWYKALEDGKVRFDDPIHIAIQKMNKTKNVAELLVWL